jgi:hypothetical protein
LLRKHELVSATCLQRLHSVAEGYIHDSDL